MQNFYQEHKVTCQPYLYSTNRILSYLTRDQTNLFDSAIYFLFQKMRIDMYLRIKTLFII